MKSAPNLPRATCPECGRSVPTYTGTTEARDGKRDVQRIATHGPGRASSFVCAGSWRQVR